MCVPETPQLRLIGQKRPRCYIRFVSNYRLVACLVCILGWGVGAAAQDGTYSADSLLAAFQKGSAVSVKGTEIKFTGVIAEIKKSRVVFMSSGDDKVICELVTPIGSRDVPVVGGSLTVVGKVRGRGVLGNVTLDPCVRTLTEVQPAPPPPPVVVPERVPETIELPEVVVEPTPAPVVELLAPEEPKKAEVVARVAAPSSAKFSTPATPLPAAATVTDTTERNQANQAEAPGSPQPIVAEPSAPTIRFTSYLPLFVASAIGMGIGAILVFMKMRPATSPAYRSASAPTPEEERRAALEALLLGKKKKR